MPVTSGPRIDGARDNQVVVGRQNLQRIFDLNVVFLDFGPTLGVGEQDCFLCFPLCIRENMVMIQTKANA